MLEFEEERKAPVPISTKDPSDLIMAGAVPVAF